MEDGWGGARVVGVKWDIMGLSQAKVKRTWLAAVGSSMHARRVLVQQRAWFSPWQEPLCG